MDQVRWLGEHEQRAWRSLMKMEADLAQYIERQLRARHGLSMADFEVLALLAEVEDGLRAVELGALLRWEKGRLSQHLTRMERRGLVVREEAPPGRRGNLVVLTEQGRAAIDAAAGPHVTDVREIFLDHVTPAQLDVLCQLGDLVRRRREALEGVSEERDGSAQLDD